jgi:hypothetical protein
MRRQGAGLPFLPADTMPFDSAQTSFLLPLAMFAFVSSVTPGPNNVMLTASAPALAIAAPCPTCWASRWAWW